MFHGVGVDGVAFQKWFKMEEHVKNEAIVVYANGVNGQWDLRGTRDLDYFDDLIEKLGETYCINPSRILGFGFSLGAYFADYLGCTRAESLKAIAMGAGGSQRSQPSCKSLPVFVTSRTSDTVVPVNLGQRARSFWQVSNQCGPATSRSDQNDNGDSMGFCETHTSCAGPGALTYCEDSSNPEGWPQEWNHTVREFYRDYAYQWFKALP